MKKYFLLLFLAQLLLAEEKVDLSAVHRIKAEAFQNSKVMEHAFHLTDVYGPRLTGSPGLKAAAEWAVRTMKGWGLADVKLEPWGPFGRGWANVRFAAHMKEPQYMPLIGVPRPWSPGTNGSLSGEPVLAPMRAEADFAKYKGKLKRKIVLLEAPAALATSNDAGMHRYTDAELVQEATAPGAAGPRPPYDREAIRKFRNALNKFLKEEGALMTIVPSSRRAGTDSGGGTIFSSAAGSWDPKEEAPPPAAAIASEHYDRIARLLEKKIPVTLEFEIESKFYDETKDSFNVTAELPGTSRQDEIVMVGAHLDSWTFGTGATDNASGSAVVMEVMRILKSLDLHLPRTVRLALWTGEEQGLLGSKAYIKQHFGDPEKMELRREHKKLSGYFNLDNGTGKIRGVYLQGNDMMRPVFQAWLEPFRDFGATTVTIRNTSGTDHLSFDAVGLPGFQFIQDPVEYSTRTHHSNMDTYDRLQAGDLMEAAAIMASVVYDAATRDEMLPRKPLPKPAKAGRDASPAR